ncbi:hypothetical protein BGX34_005986, partial [Mortierella sp. NVP85]
MQSHDDGQRLDQLKCTFGSCTKEYQTRIRYEQHLRTHQKETEEGSADHAISDDTEGQPETETTAEQSITEEGQPETKAEFICSTCSTFFYDVEIFNAHLDSHDGASVMVEDSDNATDDHEKAISTLRDDLMSTVHNKDLVDLMFKWTVPAICTHESGNTIGAETLPTHFQDALGGGLVDMDSYEPLEQSMFLANFKQKKEELARTFAGALIHFGSTVIMLLKVEIYGREPSEDVHAFDLAIPKADLRTIVRVQHDNTRKLVIGTMTYNVLVTSAIELSNCTISVGADSTLHVSENSQIWARKDKHLNPLLFRQLRSKFDFKSTLFQCASVYYNFCSWNLCPVTVPGLWNYHIKDRTVTGLNATAKLFYDMYDTGSISRGLLEKSLQKLESKESTAKNGFRSLLATFSQDQKEREVEDDKEMSKILRVLADGMCNAIKKLNQDK